jgi:hypothetical protein
MTHSYQRRQKIGGQFAWRLVEMLESPAYRVLSVSAHRVLARIEIEMAHHGGLDNGKLPVTFEDFERYGIHHHAIGPGIREAVALGFLEVTERGQAGNREFRRPNRYRLTYRHVGRGNPTNEWRRIASIEQAEEIAQEARKPLAPRRARKQKTTAGKRGVSLPETGSENGKAPLPASSRLFDLNGEANRVRKKQSSAIIAADV